MIHGKKTPRDDVDSHSESGSPHHHKNSLDHVYLGTIIRGRWETVNDAITPASGFVNAMSAIWIGMGVSIICYFFVAVVKPKFGYDDSLDAFGVHGIGGIWGALATGLWADKAVNPAGNNGLFYGNPGLFLVQFKAVLITIIYSFAVSFILLKIVNAWTGLRVSENEERIGLDLTQHSEAAYTVIE